MSQTKPNQTTLYNRFANISYMACYDIVISNIAYFPLLPRCDANASSYHFQGKKQLYYYSQFQEQVLLLIL